MSQRRSSFSLMVKSLFFPNFKKYYKFVCVRLCESVSLCMVEKNIASVFGGV